MLEVSVRTIYRDLADLQVQGIPIDRERGVGYLLSEGFFLPPLALTAQESEALQWGVAFVRPHGDDAPAWAAQELQVKLQVTSATTIPVTGVAYGAQKTRHQKAALAKIRNAIAGRRKLLINDTDAASAQSVRTVRPLELEHRGDVWTLTAWCERRNDFRVFRLDRIGTSYGLDEPFRPKRGKPIEDHLQRLTAEKPNAA